MPQILESLGSRHLAFLFSFPTFLSLLTHWKNTSIWASPEPVVEPGWEAAASQGVCLGEVRVWPLWSGSAVQPPTSLNQGHQPSLRAQPLMLFSAWALALPPCEEGVNRVVYGLCSRRFSEAVVGSAAVSNTQQPSFEGIMAFPSPGGPDEAVSHRCPASPLVCDAADR